MFLQISKIILVAAHGAKCSTKKKHRSLPSVKLTSEYMIERHWNFCFTTKRIEWKYFGCIGYCSMKEKMCKNCKI